MLASNFFNNLALIKVQDVIAHVGSFEALASLFLLAGTVLAIDYGYMLYMRSRMPPGPFPLPIVGNTFSLPDKKPWLYFEELSKYYKCPVITFWIGR